MTRVADPDGGRYWIVDQPPDRPFGADTCGVVDEHDGGVIAFVHRANAERVLNALRTTDPEGV